MSSPASTAAETRAAILDAAMTHLADGSPNVGMETIADRAGVSRATLYYHFHGRDELVATLIEQHIDELAEVVEQAAASGDPLAVIEALLDFFCAQPVRSRFLFTHLLTAPHSDQILRREQQEVVEPFEACLRAQGHGDDSPLIAEALLGGVHGVLFGRLLREEPLDRGRLGTTLSELATRMLAR